MAPIDRSLFSGENNIDIGHLDGLEIGNEVEAVEEALSRWDWDGRATGCVILRLSPDNTAVNGGTFATRGRLTKDEFKTEAVKIWPTAEAGTLLTIQVPDARTFTFKQGNMASDLVDMNEVEHCITSGNRLVLQDDYREKGIGHFSLRLVCHLAKATAKGGVMLRFTVVLFPASGEEVLAASDLASQPGWPGFKVAEGDMGLYPRATIEWGCPILPLLLTGSAWGNEITAPEGAEMRDRIAAIMATSEPADTGKTRKSLVSKWEKYRKSPGEFPTKRSPVTWPKPLPRRNQGKTLISHPVNVHIGYCKSRSQIQAA
jgi:hypothetical protein